MQKLILILSLFIFTAHHGISQDETKPLGSFEFGFNSTALLSNLLPFDSNISQNANDNLLFFKIGNGKSYFRTAVNVNSESLEEENAKFFNSFALLKIGFENKSRLSKSWVFHSGFEAFGSYRAASTESNDSFQGNFNNKEVTTGIGGAGIYGIQWMINNRIALGTEGYLRFSFSETVSETTTFTGNSNDQKSKSTEFNLDLPRSILLSFYF